jgi:hypothetical protein
MYFIYFKLLIHCFSNACVTGQIKPAEARHYGINLEENKVLKAY